MKNNYIEKLHMLFFTRHLLSKKNIKKLQKNIFYTESSRKPFQLSTKKTWNLQCISTQTWLEKKRIFYFRVSSVKNRSYNPHKFSRDYRILLWIP